MSTRFNRRASVLAFVMVLACGLGYAETAGAAYAPTPTGPAKWTPDGAVLASVVAAGKVFVGGDFTGGVAALSQRTGALLWSGHANGDVRALAMSADSGHVLIGGAFTKVNGASHDHLASLSATTGTSSPRWTANASATVRDMVVSGDILYFGGAFSSHDGVAQRSLGAVTVDTGKPVRAFTASTDKRVFGLALDGSRLVFAGNFTHADGKPRASLASVNLMTHRLDGWDPARLCASCAQYWDVAVDKGVAFIGSSGNRLGAYNMTNGKQAWKSISASGDVQAVAVSDGLVYAGGHFGKFANQPRRLLAAVSESTGHLNAAFTPTFVTSYPGIWTLTATSSDLYVGGYFSAAGPFKPRRYPYLAIFRTE
jgi:outer membrane protein assembly factor BamB